MPLCLAHLLIFWLFIHCLESGNLLQGQLSWLPKISTSLEPPCFWANQDSRSSHGKKSSHFLLCKSKTAPEPWSGATDLCSSSPAQQSVIFQPKDGGRPVSTSVAPRYLTPSENPHCRHQLRELKGKSHTLRVFLPALPIRPSAFPSRDECRG